MFSSATNGFTTDTRIFQHFTGDCDLKSYCLIHISLAGFPTFCSWTYSVSKQILDICNYHDSGFVLIRQGIFRTKFAGENPSPFCTYVFLDLFYRRIMGVFFLVTSAFTDMRAGSNGVPEHCVIRSCLQMGFRASDVLIRRRGCWDT